MTAPCTECPDLPEAPFDDPALTPPASACSTRRPSCSTGGGSGPSASTSSRRSPAPRRRRCTTGSARRTSWSRSTCVAGPGDGRPFCSRTCTTPARTGVLAVFDALAAWLREQGRGCAFVNAYAEVGGTGHPAEVGDPRGEGLDAAGVRRSRRRRVDWAPSCTCSTRAPWSRTPRGAGRTPSRPRGRRRAAGRRTGPPGVTARDRRADGAHGPSSPGPPVSACAAATTSAAAGPARSAAPAARRPARAATRSPSGRRPRGERAYRTRYRRAGPRGRRYRGRRATDLVPRADERRVRAARAAAVSRDHVFAELGGRTVEQALEAGIDPRTGVARRLRGLRRAGRPPMSERASSDRRARQGSRPACRRRIERVFDRIYPHRLAAVHSRRRERGTVGAAPTVRPWAPASHARRSPVPQSAHQRGGQGDDRTRPREGAAARPRPDREEPRQGLGDAPRRRHPPADRRHPHRLDRPRRRARRGRPAARPRRGDLRAGVQR